ncbi:hypothetical protein PFISCL1PPCAC_19600, partial [Pristionchus fissidentatus]
SPTPSNSSKKTNSSNDMRSTLRGKIREKAQSLVDRTRESAALSRRLERKITLSTPITSPSDIDADDTLIQKAINRGATIISSEAGARNELSDEMQTIFLTQNYKEEETEKEERPLTIFHGAIASPPIDEKTLKIYSELALQDPESSPSFFNSIPSFNWSRISHRLGGISLNGKWTTNDDHFIETQSDHDYLAVYQSPQWSTLNRNGGLDEIQVDIGRVVLSSHWAFSIEDEAAFLLREKYEEQAELALQIVEEVKRGTKDITTRLADAFILHEKFIAMGNRVERAANRLREIRDQQGYSTNPLQLIPGEHDRTALSISSLGKLISVPIKMEGVSNEEKKRLAMIDKIRIQLVVHYNDIFVLRTKAKNLNEFIGSLKQKQKYFLEVHSAPVSITLSIVERLNRRDRVLAVIGLPLPQKIVKMEFASNEIPQGYPVINNSILRGFVEIGVAWMGEGGINERNEEDLSSRPFSLFLPECDLDEFFYDESIGMKIDEENLREEQMSPIGMRLRLERERIVNKTMALNLRKNLLDRMENRRPTVEDLVKEEQIPTLSIAFGSLFGPTDVSRKLKPMRKDPTRTQALTTSSYRLIINIQSSRKLPLRKDGTSLRPFVAITVNKKTYRTPTANGVNANWQHTVIIEGEGSRADISPVSIQVFDEMVHKLPQDNRLVNTRHEESLHNILGSAEICSSTFIARSKVDAFVKLTSPVFSSHYKIEESHSSHIKILIALEPASIIPIHTFPSLNQGESNEVSSLCLKWSSDCSSLFPDRYFISTVFNVEGKSLVATRFLRPLNAPSSIDIHRSNPLEYCRQATRAVSLIPFLPIDSTLTALPHLWCSNDQLLSLEYGSREEHGVLLACWCLSLSLPVFLLLGRSTAENSAIVMVELPHGKVLLNPLDGSMISSDDEVSPFSIHTLVTPSNIYGNIQSQSHTAMIHFDITKKDSWRPLFDREVSLPSVQPQSLQYSMMEEDSLVELRSSLERALKLRIDESRSFGLPQWNLLTSRSLRESLSSPSSLTDFVTRSQSSFHTSILVICTPFTSISESIDQIIASRVHLSAHPQTQFALSVSIDNVFNTTVSITLALAVLTPVQSFVP